MYLGKYLDAYERHIPKLDSIDIPSHDIPSEKIKITPIALLV